MHRYVDYDHETIIKVLDITTKYILTGVLSEEDRQILKHYTSK